MKRWTSWAQQFRSRYGRREWRSAAGSMVFLRRHAPVSQSFLVSSPRIGVTLQVRAGVTLAHSPIVPLAASRPAPSISTTLRQTVVHNASPQIATAQLPPTQPAPAAVIHRRTVMFAPRPQAVAIQRQATPQRTDLPALVTAWRAKPAPTQAAIELPAILKRRVIRTEQSVQEPARILPAPAAKAAAQSNNTQAPAQHTPAMPPPPAMQTAPAFNVDALTSQVIQQIDRRLIAYRERMGRV